MSEAAIYLSPHYDDAAFSLGAWIAAHPGGAIVNIFTRSGYLAVGGGGLNPDPAVVERISAIRRAEDRQFTTRYGLEAIELGLEEPSLRGRMSRDAAGVEDDIAQLRGPLTALLDERSTGQAIYCPAAIGGHVNHLATRTVSLQWAAERGREADLRFYEDLPYASRRDHRGPGLRNLKAALGGRALRRTAWLAGGEKLAAVNFYPSQHRRLRTSLWRFSPFALWPPGPHEAIWSLTTS